MILRKVNSSFRIFLLTLKLTVHVVTPANFVKPKENKSHLAKKSSVATPVRSNNHVEEVTDEEESINDNLIEDNSHWEKISSFRLSDGLPIIKYKSNKTGLTVVLAKAESPIVNGYFCLATEVKILLLWLSKE